MRRCCKYIAGIAATIIIVVASDKTSGAAEPPRTVTFQREPGKVVVEVGDQRIAKYVFADPQVPRPYLADVREPGGIQLTRNFPPREGQDRTDHATMHPGIWLAFGDLDGTDIWRNKGRVVHQRFVDEPKSHPQRSAFAVRNRYETADGQLICYEYCRLSFLLRAGGYLVLWDSTFSADREFSFGDQEEMGLGVRVATPIAVDSKPGGRILASDGGKNEAAIWGKTAQWCDYSGPVEGHYAGITLMPDPANFRMCRWHARDYGFVTANPFGRAAFQAGPASKVVVKPDNPLRLRFGLFVHCSDSEGDLDLSAAYQAYLEELKQQEAANGEAAR